MKKLTTIIAAVAVAFGFSAQAQILFKVEKAGNAKASYILGTHHFAPLSAVDSIKELPEIMKGIDKLYGEIEMSQMKDPAVIMGMQQMLMAPADSTLDKVFSPVELDSITTVWNEFTGGSVPLSSMNIVKPSVISTQLAAMMTQKALPELNPLEGIDMTMQARAAELGKPVAGLESMQFQMDMLYNQPISEQAKSLMKTIRGYKEEGEKAVELSKAYLAHDINKIYETIASLEDESPESLERMIYSRNDNWVKTLTEEMPGKSLMIVVGAGHLPGERGVLESLKKAGYTITPVD